MNRGTLNFGILPGAIYRHYKGGVASVVGVPYAALPSLYPEMPVFAIARWADGTPGEVRIVRDAVGSLCFSPEWGNDPLVLYSCSGGLWVRTVRDFLGHVSTGPQKYLGMQRFLRLTDDEEIIKMAFGVQRERNELALQPDLSGLNLLQTLGIED